MLFPDCNRRFQTQSRSGECKFLHRSVFETIYSSGTLAQPRRGSCPSTTNQPWSGWIGEPILGNPHGALDFRWRVRSRRCAASLPFLRRARSALSVMVYSPSHRNALTGEVSTTPIPAGNKYLRLIQHFDAQSASCPGEGQHGVQFFVIEQHMYHAPPSSTEASFTNLASFRHSLPHQLHPPR